MPCQHSTSRGMQERGHREARESVMSTKRHRARTVRLSKHGGDESESRSAIRHQRTKMFAKQCLSISIVYANLALTCTWHTTEAGSRSAGAAARLFSLILARRNCSRPRALKRMGSSSGPRPPRPASSSRADLQKHGTGEGMWWEG